MNILEHVLKVWSLGSLPSAPPGPFTGSGMAKLFSYIKILWLFHCVASSANGAKGTVGKTAVLRPGSGTKQHQSHRIHHCHMVKVEKASLT